MVDVTPYDLTSLTCVMLEDQPGGTANLSRKVGFDEIPDNNEAVLVEKWEQEWRRVQEWVQPHFARPETRTSAEAMRDDVLAYARERLGEGGILAVDETGFLKKGNKSAGVARQYSGTAGRVDELPGRGFPGLRH